MSTEDELVDELRGILRSEDGGTARTEAMQTILLELAQLRRRILLHGDAAHAFDDTAPLVPWVPPELRAEVWGVLLGVRVRAHDPDIDQQDGSTMQDTAAHMSEAIRDTELDLKN